MPVYKILTAVIIALVLMGCGKSGGGDSSPGAAAIGSYQANFKTTTGDAYILSLDFAAGAAEVRTYYFKAGNITSGAFQKGIGSYVVNGSSYTVTYSYKTCNHVPSNVYELVPIDGDTVSVTVEGKQFIFHKVTSIDKFLADAGMLAAIEDTGCNQLPTN